MAGGGTASFPGNVVLGNNAGDDIEIIGQVKTPLPLASGRITFPSTQNPSADANTLDDYNEGTFTPSITSVTVGDLAITYTSQVGKYTKIGDCVLFSIYIATSAFTYTTAAGELRILGMPYTTANTVINEPYSTLVGGWTAPANGIGLQAFSPGSSYLSFRVQYNNGALPTVVQITQFASGTTPSIAISGQYYTS